MESLCVVYDIDLPDTAEHYLTDYYAEVKSELERIWATKCMVVTKKTFTLAEVIHPKLQECIEAAWTTIVKETQCYTVLDTIHEIKRYIWWNSKRWEVKRVSIICPNFYMPKLIFLSTKHLATMFGFARSEYEIFEFVIDILKVKDRSDLITAREYIMWKLQLVSIETERPAELYRKEILSSVREMVCDRYPNLNDEYIEWSKPHKHSKQD